MELAKLMKLGKTVPGYFRLLRKPVPCILGGLARSGFRLQTMQKPCNLHHFMDTREMLYHEHEYDLLN